MQATDYTIDWLEDAVQEKNDIVDFIAQQGSILAAISVDERIEEEVGKLAQFPLLGRVGRIRGTFELVISKLPYIVVYEINTEDMIVLILYVFHEKQTGPRFIRVR